MDIAKAKCKDLKHKVIKLKRNLTTNGGEQYYRGELLVITEALKDGTIELKRVGKGLRCNREEIDEILGSSKDIFGV